MGKKTHDQFGRPIWIGSALTGGSAIIWILGISGLPENVGVWHKWLTWLFVSPHGKALCALLADLVLLWYWWLWPWIYNSSHKRIIAKLCDDLDRIPLSVSHPPVELRIASATIACGGYVRKLRESGAFSDDPATEGYIDAATANQLIEQMGSDPGPARSGEYQAFFIAAKRIGKSRGVEIAGDLTIENLSALCSLISGDIRANKGLKPRITQK